ncbi:ABC transporter permease [Mariniblastus fucicola]|uniref:ABC-2 family transporter protein n=1 Tax=Mariniblastus fucicola TaxID=980251 RepID=A0A5B9PBQ9_9BACT|nr:ABC transporter permease subunit [Mariniblastus fucicola]QEG24157.1 ABC-2 family transporter protein [Mariniblastus fucicola]
MIENSLPLILAQDIRVTYWLTPVWILSAGITLGFLLVLLSYLKISILQRIPGINSVASKRGSFIVGGIVLTLVYLGCYAAFLYWVQAFTFDLNRDLQPMLYMLPVCALFGFGAWTLVAKKFAGEFSSQFNEGLLKWLNRICIAFTIFFVIGFPLAKFNGFGVIEPVEEPVELMKSLARLPFATSVTDSMTIEPSERNHAGDQFPVNFHGRELKGIRINSTEPIEVAAEPIRGDLLYILRVDPSEELRSYSPRSDGQGMFKHETYNEIYINNLGDEPAQVTVTIGTGPFYSEVIVIPIVAAIVLLTYLLPLMLASALPKISAIALSTFKTEVSQPLFLLVILVGAAFIVTAIYIPYNTFGEDIKMYKDSGLNLLRVMAIFTAVWAASKSVAEEIEGRTALTVLSKPVSRRQFILGKFSGISMSVALLFLLLGLWFMIWVAYKPVYDGQEAANKLRDWAQPFTESFNIAPGLFLCFLEIVIFVAISVAISTRMGILANFLICASIYVLGHLTPMIVQSSVAQFEPVVVFGQLVSTVFPVLDHFDIQAAISRNTSVPLAYLAEMLVYTGLYSTVAMLLSLVFFEDRDLA